MAKLIYIILDGLGDRPIRELGYKTPLEAASKPNWDLLAKKAQLGMHWAIAKNFAPESDAATLALLGYNPFKYYTGRGPLEAYGADINLRRGELAIRCNFALEEKNYLKEIEANVSDLVAKKICSELNKNVKKINSIKTKIYATKGYRAVLILKGKGLSTAVSGNHPGYKQFKGSVSVALRSRKGRIKLCKALAKTSSAKKTANILNTWLLLANKYLKNSKYSNLTNTILLRGIGTKIPNLPKRPGWAALVAMPAERAISKLAGMHIYKLKLEKLHNQLEQLIKNYSAIYVHIKQPDSYSHLGNFFAKKSFFEKFDTFFAKYLCSKKLVNCLLCITGDHTTPCKIRAHTGDPVPVMLYLPGQKGDNLAFGERNCAKGSLGKLTGLKLFNKLSNLLKNG
ncbi:MAG: hypothetical protein ACP5JY_01040 [Candidatus Nanoarchaeia archaeon]